MNLHELDRGPRFWIAAAGLACLTGALLAPGCAWHDAGAAQRMSSSGAIERGVSELVVAR